MEAKILAKNYSGEQFALQMAVAESRNDTWILLVQDLAMEV